MSNRLSMSKIHSIETLHQSGHSNRKIARLLNVDRGSQVVFVRILPIFPMRKCLLLNAALMPC